MNPKGAKEKVFINPVTGKPFLWDEYYAFHDTLIAFGLGQEYEQRLREMARSIKMKFCFTNDITDLYGIPACSIIINTAQLSDGEISELFEFYSDIKDLKVILLQPATVLKNSQMKCQADVNPLTDIGKLRLDILKHKKSLENKQNNAEKYGNRVLRILAILKFLKSNRTITSAALAKQMDVSVRTIQRDLVLLEALGEPLGYDPQSKGYFLLTGKSFLWED
jgi:hypothetical protein